MIFDSRKNLELTDNYVGGRRDFEFLFVPDGRQQEFCPAEFLCIYIF